MQAFRQPMCIAALFAVTVSVSVSASAQTSPAGQMTVAGKTVKPTNVYAYATPGFFDRRANDTVVMLADRSLTDAQIHDEFGLRRLATAGKLNYVQATIDPTGQMINCTVASQEFKAIPSGGSTGQVFEGALHGQTIAGKVRTKSRQEFFGTQYEFEATFRTAVQARK